MSIRGAEGPTNRCDFVVNMCVKSNQKPAAACVYYVDLVFNAQISFFAHELKTTDAGHLSLESSWLRIEGAADGVRINTHCYHLPIQVCFQPLYLAA